MTYLSHANLEHNWTNGSRNNYCTIPMITWNYTLELTKAGKPNKKIFVVSIISLQQTPGQFLKKNCRPDTIYIQILFCIIKMFLFKCYV